MPVTIAAFAALGKNPFGAFASKSDYCLESLQGALNQCQGMIQIAKTRL